MNTKIVSAKVQNGTLISLYDPGPIHLELGMVAENLPLRRFLRSPARKAACRGFGGPLGAETVLQGA